MSKTLFKSIQSVKVFIIRRMGIGRKEETQIKRDMGEGNEGEEEKRKGKD